MIRTISADETIAVRWPVLRPGFPRESAIFPGDDAPDTVHFGAFHSERMVGVVSIYRTIMPEQPDTTPAWQLRGMATLPEARGSGFGKALLDACVAHVRAKRPALLWCNARTSAAPFYTKHGWQFLGPEFDIPTVGPHFRMFVELS